MAVSPVSSSFFPRLHFPEQKAKLSIKERIEQLTTPMFQGETSSVTFDLDATFDSAPLTECNIKLLDERASLEGRKIQVKLERDSCIIDTENFDAYSLTLADPATDYLASCNHIFADITFYASNSNGPHASVLNTFASTDMTGKEGLALIKETLKVLDVTHCYFQDGSTITTKKCCKECAPCSLKLFQIFKKGVSWYESQGAGHVKSLEPSQVNFQELFTDPFSGIQVFYTYLETKELSGSEEVEKINHILSLSNKQYSEASNYLYNLTFSQLKELSHPYKDHPQLGEIYHSAVAMQERLELDKTARVGEALHLLREMDTDAESHTIKRNFINSVVQFDIKQLLPFLLEKLNLKSAPQILDIAYICFATHILSHLFIEVEDNLEKMAFTQGFEEFRKTVRKNVLALSPNIAADMVQSWKEDGGPNALDLKLFKESYDENLVRFFEMMLTGPQDYPRANFIIAAFHAFRNLKVQDLDRIFPGFSKDINQLVEAPVLEENSACTLFDLLSPLDEELLFLTLNTIEEYIDHKLDDSLDISDLLNQNSLESFLLAKAVIFGDSPMEFDLTRNA